LIEFRSGLISFELPSDLHDQIDANSKPARCSTLPFVSDVIFDVRIFKMSFITRRFLFAAALAAIPTASLAECPCKYKAEGLPDLTSASPIPAEHAVCLRQIQQLKRKYDEFASQVTSDKARNAHEKNSKGIELIDWGVVPKAEAEKIIATAKKTDATYREKLRVESSHLGDPGHKQDIVRNNMTLWQSQIFAAARWTAYANCVVKNGLSPTVAK
jgi:hypothetical protein